MNLASILDRTIVGANSRLVPLSHAHTEYVITWRNDPAIARWFNTVMRFERSSHERWLGAAQASGRDFNFIIEDADGRPVGTIALYNIDWKEKSAEFGRLLIGDPAAKGRGFAREASALLLKIAAEVGLKFIYLEVKPDNSTAIALYNSLNFQNVSPSSCGSNLATSNQSDGLLRMFLDLESIK